MGSKEQISAYNQIQAGQLNVRVGNQIHSQVGGTIRIEELAQQPGMGWINTLMNDPANAGKLDWERIQLTQERWSQSSNTLGPVAQAVLVAVVSFATVGAGSAAVGSGTTTAGTTATAGTAAAGTAGAAGTGAAGTGAVGTGAVGTAGAASATAGTGLAGTFGLSASTAATITPLVQAGISSIAAQAAVSFVNNNGDIGAVLTELSSIQGIRNTLSAIITAGVLQGLESTIQMNGIRMGDWTMAGVDAGTVKLPQVLAHNLINSTASSLVSAAIHGTSLEDAIRTGLIEGVIQTGAAAGANFIGQNGPGTTNPTFNAFSAQVAHAIVGCVAGAARSGNAGISSGTGCSAGAIGAVIGDLAAQAYNPDPAGNPDPNSAANTLALTQLVSSIAGAIVGGGQAAANIAASAGVNAVQNNWLSAKQNAAKEAALKACAGKPGCDPLKVIKFWDDIDTAQQTVTDNLSRAKEAVQLAAQSNDPAAQRAAAVQLATALDSASRLQQSLAGVDPYAANTVGRMISSAQDAATQAHGMAACQAKPGDCIATPQGVGNFATGLRYGVANSIIDLLNTGPAAVNGYGYIVQLASGDDSLDNAVEPLPYWSGTRPEGALQTLGNTVGSLVTSTVALGVTGAALESMAGRGAAAAVVQDAAAATETAVAGARPATTTAQGAASGAATNGGVAVVEGAIPNAANAGRIQI